VRSFYRRSAITEPRRFFFVLPLVVLAACTPHPKLSPLAELASRLPADAIVLAGADLDQLRTSKLFSSIPESFRKGSYVLAAYTGKDLVTATRDDGTIKLAGAPGSGVPADLLRHAPDAPLWLVVRGSATLPLTGNVANVNRLLHQTEYTVITATPGERISIHAEAFCRDNAAAQHLEENVRAIGSLSGLWLDVVRDGATVRVNAAISPEAIGKLF
jgi:hypothetical protein